MSATCIFLLCGQTEPRTCNEADDLLVCGRHRIAAGAGFRLDSGSESSRAAPVEYPEVAERPARTTRPANFTMRSEPNGARAKPASGLSRGRRTDSPVLGSGNKTGPRAAVALARRPPREDK